MSDVTSRAYQTHRPDRAGMSDSAKKLHRLMLPSDLTGQHVLDIGCNEGFFCHEAAVRGASEVIGIDFHKPALDAAERLYSSANVHFLHQRWDSLPDGPFDLILWTSAMHYEVDPASVFKRVLNAISSNGLFVLECGVLDWPRKEMVFASRHSDARWYPTWPLLEEMLTDFSVRRVAKAEPVEGDPVPRAVFHCTRRKTTVMLIRGEMGHGKTTLAASMAEAATKTVALDVVVSRIATGQFHHTALQKFIRDHYDPRDLSKIYRGIDDNYLTEDYAQMLAEGIARTDELVIVEGLVTELQVSALARRLGDKALLWDVQRLVAGAPSEHVDDIADR